MRKHPYKRTETDESGLEESPKHVALIDRLFREHNEALLRFLYARLRSYQEAGEVAQEAYVKLLSLDQPGAISCLRAFLFKTAANLAIDRRRRHELHTRATAEPNFHEVVDKLTPERKVAGEQQIERLQRLIAALPLKPRQAFILNQVHGKDISSVATQLGLSESMVRKYIVRALLDIRGRLDLEGPYGH